MNTKDEINACVPGYIKMDVNEIDGELSYSHNHDLNTYSEEEKAEYEIGMKYANCVKAEMERAEDEILGRFLDSNLPGKAEVAVSKFWLH